MMTELKSEYDVVVIGAGHNGLACAASLAKTGRKVIVLEALDSPGGACATSEFYEKFSVSSCAQWLYQLNDSVVSQMSLEQHGFELSARNIPTTVLCESGDHLTVFSDRLEGAGVSDKDKAAFKSFTKQMLKFCDVLSKAFKRRPPNLVDRSFGDVMALLGLGMKIKMLGKTDMRDLMRLGLINIYDVMEENFDNDLLKAAISLDSVLGSHMGPRSPNTVFGYLYRHMGEIYGYGRPGVSVVRGGMGQLGQSMAKAAKAMGVDIALNASVDRISIDLDKVTGVVLKDGREIRADIVVSSADPKTTFEKFVGLANLETDTLRRVKNVRMKGDAAKLHIALDGLPNFMGLAESRLGDRLLIAPNMEYIEKAFNPSKYGEFSTSPIMDISIPSIHDSGLAPDGKHVLSAIVQYAPYELEGGWEAGKQPFQDLLIDCLSQYYPGLKHQMLSAELLTPVDIEERHLIHGGHWHHGEISLDQVLMMRPFPGASQYCTPVDGLYLSGAGTHPGGGVMGLAGMNTAKEIISQKKNRIG